MRFGIAVVSASIAAAAGCAPSAQSGAGEAPIRVARSKIAVDFYNDFQRGTINLQQAASTPSGKGVFRERFDNNVDAFVVLAAFRYSFDIKIRADDELRFYVSRLLAAGVATRGFVDATLGSKTERLFQIDLEPQTTPTAIWNLETIDLSRYENKKIRLTFGADAPTGDQTAAWIAFGFPTIIRTQ